MIATDLYSFLSLIQKKRKHCLLPLSSCMYVRSRRFSKGTFVQRVHSNTNILICFKLYLLVSMERLSASRSRRSITLAQSRSNSQPSGVPGRPNNNTTTLKHEKIISTTAPSISGWLARPEDAQRMKCAPHASTAINQQVGEVILRDRAELIPFFERCARFGVSISRYQHESREYQLQQKGTLPNFPEF